MSPYEHVLKERLRGPSGVRMPLPERDSSMYYVVIVLLVKIAVTPAVTSVVDVVTRVLLGIGHNRCT